MVPCEAVLMFISDNSVCSEGVEVSREVRNIFTRRPYLLKAHTTISKHIRNFLDSTLREGFILKNYIF